TREPPRQAQPSGLPLGIASQAALVGAACCRSTSVVVDRPAPLGHRAREHGHASFQLSRTKRARTPNTPVGHAPPTQSCELTMSKTQVACAPLQKVLLKPVNRQPGAATVLRLRWVPRTKSVRHLPGQL